MRRCCWVIYFFFFFVCGIVNAENISSSELISKAREHDGKLVVYEGELIGSVLDRGEFVWLNLNDGVNAIGIWAPAKMASNIKFAGHDRMRGDWALVTGIFHRSCLEHGGGLDIHAQKITLLRQGYSLTEPIDPKKIKAMVLLLGVLACLMIIHILLKKQRG